MSFNQCLTENNANVKLYNVSFDTVTCKNLINNGVEASDDIEASTIKCNNLLLLTEPAMNVANSMLVADGNGLTLINTSQTNQAVLASYEYFSFQLDWLNLLDFNNIVIADATIDIVRIGELVVLNFRAVTNFDALSVAGALVADIPIPERYVPLTTIGENVLIRHQGLGDEQWLQNRIELTEAGALYITQSDNGDGKYSNGQEPYYSGFSISYIVGID